MCKLVTLYSASVNAHAKNRKVAPAFYGRRLPLNQVRISNVRLVVSVGKCLIALRPL